MIEQIEFSLPPQPRGIHLVTAEIMRHLPDLPKKGLLNLLIKHTSAALALNENADPDVRHDLTSIFDLLVPENAPFFAFAIQSGTRKVKDSEAVAQNRPFYLNSDVCSSLFYISGLPCKIYF